MTWRQPCASWRDRARLWPPGAIPCRLAFMSAPPTQASLDELFARATRVRIFDEGASSGRATGLELLAEARDSEVAEVREHLRIQEDGATRYCMCLGDLAVELLAGEERLVMLSSHHARTLRLRGWSSDALLVDGPALARWLSSRGVPGPLASYDRDRESERKEQAARRVWVAAAPPCLVEDLRRFEVHDAGRYAEKPSEHDVAESLIREAYATPELASAALLAWYGTGAGPWSGYPGYEVLPDTLLLRIGLPEAHAAAVASTDEAVLRGAARLFSAYAIGSKKRSDVLAVPEALWSRLRSVVAAMNHAGNLAWLDTAVAAAAEHRRLRERPSPSATGAELVIVGISSEGPLSGLVTAQPRPYDAPGTTLYSGQGANVLSFSVGVTTPTVLFRGKDPFFELATPAGGMMFTAHMNEGTISKIITDNGRRVVTHDDQERPTGIVAHADGGIAWINQARLTDPEQELPAFGQQSSVLLSEHPTPRRVREATERAFSLVIDEEHLYWCETAGGRFEIWRISHRRPDVAACFAELGERRPEASWLPRIVVNATHVLWADPARRALLAVEKRRGGEAVVLAETRYRPGRVVADEHDLFALTGEDGEHDWHVEHAPSQGGESRVVASYRRPLGDRPAMVLCHRALYFTTHDLILGLERA